MNFTFRLASAALLSGLLLCARAGELQIATDASDPAPKAAWEAMAQGFMKANPDVKVNITTYNHEAYKSTLGKILESDGADVVTWYAGNRMAPYVNRRQFDDVSDVWDANNMRRDFRAAVEAMTIDGKQWGVPYTNYQWGIYYNKDVFARLGLTPPKTWNEFLDVCAKLKSAGVTPFTLGSKAPWTTGGWFDYLNLRTNGYKFHMELTSGKASYLDYRVRRTFEKWGQLTKPGYFVANHASLEWQEALPALARGDAAMMLMGNFAVSLLRKQGMTNQNLGFFQFPRINDVPLAEDAPMDTAHIAARAKNKKDARRFMAYIARPEVQAQVNQILGQLPVNNKAKLDIAMNLMFNTEGGSKKAEIDPLMAAGFSMLVGVNNLAQFYDRDAPDEMAKVGLEGFQQYMLNPAVESDMLKRLEGTRLKINAETSKAK